MGLDTAIAWTHHTFNVAWGCEKISPGCAHCYADALSRRKGFDVWGHGKARRTFGPEYWRQPLRWNRAAERAGERRRVFCSSMTDWALDDPVLARERRKLWPLIFATPSLDWLLLSKRPENAERMLPADWGRGWSNVWLGVSIESNEYVQRADILRRLPAVCRFVSYEPALGPLDRLDLCGIDWVIYGGESGPGFRPHKIEWARSMRAMCEAAGVAFFYKQGPGRYPGTGVELDGEVVQDYPRPRGTRVLPVLK
ncbi:MAG: DUF5131 family protein [Phycisphaerae bacterium]|jgi:protein gp37